MNTVVTTHLDGMGRIVIPKEIRRQKGWEINDLLSIQIDDEGRVILFSESPRCCICGCDANLKEIKKKYICQDCISLL